MSDYIFLNYVLSGYPLLWVETYEEHRALTTLAQELQEAKGGRNLYSWDRINGIKLHKFEEEEGRTVLSSTKITKDKIPLDDPIVGLKWAEKDMPENSVLILLDYHHYAKKDMNSRMIRNLVPTFKAMGKVLAVVSHTVDIPHEIEKEITIINFELPDIDELRITLKSVCESAEAPYPEDDLAILEAGLGMTAFEAENAFALSLREKKEFNVRVVNREKASIVKKTGLLEVIDEPETVDDIGGLDNLKNWLGAREHCFTTKAKEFGITAPKGLLLIGVPGSGKSLSAKVVANILNRPLLRLDMGKVFGSLVGESEGNIRKCLAIAEAVAPCCLWIDELEKSFSGMKGGNGDGHGTNKRVFASFLTWLQEKKKDVFIVATANDVSAIPGEMIRGGRFDKIFWVDLPGEKQREEILNIHIKKKDRKPKDFDMKKLIKSCEQFTGAEIEVWVKESLVTSFGKGRDLCTEDMIETSKTIIPIAHLMAEDIESSRQWAKERGVTFASENKDGPVKVKSVVTGQRKIELN